MLRTIRLFLLVIGFALTLSNEVSPAKKKLPFNVKVEASSEHHKSEIESHMNRELRKISDVAINHEYPTYEILIIHLQGNISRTNFISVVVQSIVPKSVFNPNLDDSMLAYLRENIYFHEKMHSYIRNSSQSWSAICESIVADIDGEVFEPTRQLQTRIPKEAEYLFEGLED